MGLFRRRREQPLSYYYVARNAAGRVLWVGTDLSQWDGEATTSTVYGDTWEDAKRRAKDAVARIRTEIVAETVAPTPQDDAESVASTQQDDVASTPRQTEVSDESTQRTVPDTVASAPHAQHMASERGAYVVPAQERRADATVTSQRPHISNTYSGNRGGRPIKASKLKIYAVMVDYYRNRDGLQQDIDFILDKTGIGPAGLARALGVDRTRMHDWRAHGMPRTMDPLAFCQIVLWTLALRRKWPWER